MRNTSKFPVIADLDKLKLTDKTINKEYIIIHHSATDAGNAESFHRYHIEHNNWRALGYHFVINNGKRQSDLFDGMIQCNMARDWDNDFDFTEETGAHAKGLNSKSIGICVVGDFSKGFPTPNQILATTALVTHLNHIKYNIKYREYVVIGHREAGEHGGALVYKSCPGENINCNLMRTFFITQRAHYTVNKLNYKSGIATSLDGQYYNDVVYYDELING